MNADFFKKILKNVVGIDDATIEKLFVENADTTTLDALIPEISTANRAKWETTLLADTKFTEPLTARGFSAGQAKAYQSKKDAILKAIGLNISPDADEYKDNEKFQNAVRTHFEAQKTAKGGDAEAIAKLKSDFEAQKLQAIDAERGVLNAGFAQQLKVLQEKNILKTALLTHAAGKKFKGGLSVDDLMPAIEAKTKSYKFEFDTERGAISKALGLDGHEIDNKTKDGKLTPSEILTNIFSNFVETEQQNTGGQGNGNNNQGNGGEGQRQGDANNTILAGNLAQLQALR